MSERLVFPEYEAPKVGKPLWFLIDGRSERCDVEAIEGDQMRLRYGAITFRTSVSDYISRREAEYADGHPHGEMCAVCGDDADDCLCL